MPKTNNSNLSEKIKKAPTEPGCYLYRNRAGNIIYIGKAKNIRKRVQSYFTKNIADPKTQQLVAQIHDVEFIITNTEVEALILENTLIKKHHPRYNIWFRDDKTYPYVRITNEPFPQVFITRKIVKDGSRYFGPYTDSYLLKNTLKIIKTIFPVRTCHYKLDEKSINSGKIKLCLDYHIKKCEGPCQKLISLEEYNAMINQVCAFLNGKTTTAIEFYRQKMYQAAAAEKFETAALYRDKISILQNYSNRQVVESNDFIDRDVIGIAKEEDLACVVLLRIREGKLIGREVFYIEGIEIASTGMIIQSFLQTYYAQSNAAPTEILSEELPEDVDLLTDWFKSRDFKVKILAPKRGEKTHLLEIAQKNARMNLQETLLKRRQKAEFIPKSLLNLQKELNLPKLPQRIEAFDISTMQGKFAVGSMVTFIKAQAKPNEYRRFKIKTVSGIDDFAMMAEVVERRYKRQTAEHGILPDLILIDGGKGQLNAAYEVLIKLNLASIPVIGLAKRLEEVFIPQATEPVLLPKASIALQLLQRIRDEAHRFAITYHRKIRQKQPPKSVLDEIAGLGETKKQALLKAFRSISNIRKASVSDLMTVKGIGPKMAQNIKLALTTTKDNEGNG